MSDSVLLSVDNQGIATITLNRPDLHNALDGDMASLLLATLETVAADPEIRVLVLTGNGLNFSTGYDADWLRKNAALPADEQARHLAVLARLLHTLDTLPQPTIARVQGSAFGMGAGLAACCDVAVGVAESLYSFPDVKLGAIPGVIAPYIIRAIGPRAARRYFITAERFNAGKAKRLGLLHIVVESDALDSAIGALLAQLMQNGPQAMGAAKRLVAALLPLGDSEAACELAIRDTAAQRCSEEGHEGVHAFLDKRKPHWVH